MQQLPAMFIAGDTALDFLNSLATPVDVPVDWLEDGAGLLSWLEQARLVPAAELERVRARFAPGELNKVAEQARSLREWFRDFAQRQRGVSRRDIRKVELLNRLLERDESFNQVALAKSAQGATFEMRAMRRWRSPDALLSPIAEAIARLVCSQEFAHVKACEGPNCTLLFVDETRSHGRRWCSMAVCGNRAKQAAHRRRLKSNR
jgi:predicted RNA-binding Zn ribbon-like protein